MTALFINLKISSEEKCQFFINTLSDIAGLFNECHIKIRGEYSQDCLEWCKLNLNGNSKYYQNLSGLDWVDDSLRMVKNIKARSIFFFIEDHKLIKPKKSLVDLLSLFDANKMDYICYSFFYNAGLNIQNILPLNAREHGLFRSFTLNLKNQNLIKKISPNYCVFSLLSMVSVDYFRSMLEIENKRIKIYPKRIIGIMALVFRFPIYRIFLNKLNRMLSPLKIRILINAKDSPFNMEKLISECVIPGNWKYGVLKEEFYLNYDDDNQIYGQSLIKRGLYPFLSNVMHGEKLKFSVSFIRNIADHEEIDLTYYSRKSRINRVPVIKLLVLDGVVAVNYCGQVSTLKKNEIEYYYSNLRPKITAIEKSSITIYISDVQIE